MPKKKQYNYNRTFEMRQGTVHKDAPNLKILPPTQTLDQGEEKGGELSLESRLRHVAGHLLSKGGGHLVLAEASCQLLLISQLHQQLQRRKHALAAAGGVGGRGLVGGGDEDGLDAGQHLVHLN